MTRPLFAVCLRSIKFSAWEWIAPKTGPRNTLKFVGAWRLYGTSIGCQTTAPTNRFIQNEIIKALCSGERSRAFSLLSELVSEKEQLESQDFVRILRYCASEPDPLFGMEIWHLMREKEIAPSVGCRYIIQALCKGGYLKEAFSILSTLEENSAGTLMLPMCTIFLQASIQKNDYHYAYDCLRLMEDHALGKSEIIYGLLLKLAVLCQDLSTVHEIWKECNSIYPVSIVILRKFIWAFTSLKDLEYANIALQKMVAVSSQGNVHFVRSAEGKLHRLGLDVPIPHHDLLTRDIRDGENSNIPTNALHDCYTEENSSTSGFNLGLEAKEVVASENSNIPTKSVHDCYTEDNSSTSGFNRGLEARGLVLIKYLRWSFNDVIHTCASMKNISLAEKLMLQMQNLGLEPSSSTYNGYVQALLSSRRFQYVVEVLEVMQRKSLKPKSCTLAAASISCSKALELDLAESFLHEIPECTHASPYNALFKACDTLDQPERALRLFTKMKRLNVTADIRTYENLFKLFCNVNAPYEDANRLSQAEAATRIRAIEMDMVRHGIQHSHVSMQYVMQALGMEGMTSELIRYLHVAEDLFFDADAESWIFSYSIVLHSLVDAKETHAAIEIFKRMISNGFTPDTVTYNIMIDCCSVIRCYKSACTVLSMMIRSGFCPGRNTYTTLIKVLLGSGDFDEALKLLEMARSEGIQPDVLFYNTIIKQAGEKGRIDLVELFVEQMHQDKLKPDTSTCECVFSAYAHNGLNTTALEALQVLSFRMISIDDNVLKKAAVEYDSLIFTESAQAESQIIRILRTSPTLCMAILNLRWCSMMGCDVSWEPNNSPWAKRLSLAHARESLVG